MWRAAEKRDFFRSIKKVAHRKVVSHARNNLVILIIVD